MARKSSVTAPQSPPRSPMQFARQLAKQCAEFGIRQTAKRAKLPLPSLARKINDPTSLTAKDMERMAPIFGFDVAKTTEK